MTVVNGFVSKLNYEWFIEKKKFFSKEQLYVPTLDKIYEIIPNPDYYEDDTGNWIETNKDIVVDIDLANYCWNSDFYGSNQQSISESFITTAPVDGSDIAENILNVIIAGTEKFTEPLAINNYILSIVEEVKKEIQELLVSNDDSEYQGVLDIFFCNTRKIISKKFYHIKEQVELTANYEERLEFNLTQEKLAALLYILNKAEVFNTINFNDTTFLHFCQQFFYFKFKDSYKRPKSLKTFTDKYREFVRGENRKSLDELKEKITKVLKEI